jgi:3-deoxy-D-manno-octulosonic-acid transferase
VIWIYRLLFLPVFFLHLPFGWWRTRKRVGKKFWRERLGLLSLETTHRKRLWIHAVSVGEMQSLQPLVERIFADSRFDLVISVTTTTGRAIAEKLYGKMAKIIYFPVDFCICSACAWKNIRPNLAILCDSELWPEHLHQAKRHSVPLWLINGRISDRTFRRYRRFQRIAKWLWSHVSVTFPNGKEAAKRIEKFFPHGTVTDHGNLKCERKQMVPLNSHERTALLQELGLSTGNNEQILFGCSTWPGEEEVLIHVFEKLHQCDKNWRLILVPRHGERKDEICAILRRKNIVYHVRSSGIAKEKNAMAALIDTTGELSSLIALATVAFLGKTLPPNGGGQSPLDAVAAAVPLVTGPNYSNFREIVDELRIKNCLTVCRNREEVVEALQHLAHEKTLRQEIGKKMGDWLVKNSCISQKIYEKILNQFQLSRLSL